MDLETGQYQCFDRGLQAYRLRDYRSAARFFQTVVDEDPEDWNAMLYLAMSLYLAGDRYLAANKFSTLKDCCPHSEIREKAESAYLAIQGQAPD